MDLTRQLWKCARSSTMVEYEGNMMILKSMNEHAWNWLKKNEAEHWSKTSFSTFPKCDNLLNNACEQFNSKIVRYRGKPIITMLEEIRCYLMRKQNKHRLTANSYKGKICPLGHSRLEKNRKEMSAWTPELIGDAQGYRFQVWKRPQCKKVDIGAWECTCRMWQLTGVPCMHAIACLAYKNLHAEDFIDPCYSTEKWRATYVPYTEAIAGEDDWTPTNLQPIEPPHYTRKTGRPKTKRRKSKDEPKTQSQSLAAGTSRGQAQINSGVAPRKIGEINCSLCGQPGHNKRKCPKAPIKAGAATTSIEVTGQVTGQENANSAKPPRKQNKHCCSVCGQPGHYKATCPKKQYAKDLLPPRAAAAGATTSAPGFRSSSSVEATISTRSRAPIATKTRAEVAGTSKGSNTRMKKN